MAHPLRFWVIWRTLMGYTDLPLEGGTARPISILSASVASYLCYLMLTCTHSNDATHSFRYDWTQPAAREVWVEAVTNMTATGVVDGIFADHSANEGSNIGTVASKPLPPPSIRRGPG